MVVGWGILSPLSKYMGWAPGPVGDMSTGARGWILWVSLGIMCADSFVSLVPIMWESFMEFFFARGTPGKQDRETESESRLVPHRWVVIGLTGSIVVGTLLVYIVFGSEGIKPWATLIGFILGGVLSVFGYVSSSYCLNVGSDHFMTEFVPWERPI